MVSWSEWWVEEGSKEDVQWTARERADGRAARARMRKDCMVMVKMEGVSYLVGI